ncbi:MAG: family transporter protein [Verrucomicrobiales bacterium]|nr:family transporter protein [Verrucomicrobiales bacterium]
MRQFLTIAKNTFMELVRQPIFLLLMTASASFEVFLSCVNYFGFGDEPKLVKNSVLAVMLLSGLFGAVLSASAAVAREIRTGTALAVLSKPIGRAQFLLAKYFGLAAALTVLTYFNALAALFASRMAFDAYGSVDIQALALFGGAIGSGYIFAGFTNFFLRRPFMADAVLSVVVTLTIGFVIMSLLKKEIIWIDGNKGVDWRLVPASILILFALWILAALALACSTRFEMIPTLAICSALFLIGLMSDYFYQKAGGKINGGPPFATVLYTIVPNWQQFWLADLLETGKQFPWTYVGKAFLYVVTYVGATLSLALFLFQDRELS